MNSRPPIKVLYCENNVDGTVGGSYYSLLFLVTGLDRTRYQPIVVFYTDHSLIPAFRDAGIETLVWPKPKPLTFGSRLDGAMAWLQLPALAIQKPLNYLRRFMIPALKRAKFLKSRGVRLVHLNNSILYNHDWMFAARLCGVSCVTHERGINEHYPAAARYFGKGLDAVICISEAVKQNMRERGADLPNLVTIHNGLDPAVMRVRIPAAELRAQLNLGPDAPVVGMIGNLKMWKGQETVVHAIDRVRRTCPSIRCVFVGDTSPGDREFASALHARVASLGLQEHIVFAGFQKNVADFLMMFDVPIHASVSPEPFGRVILEAMACRKPVIGSRAGAIPEIIEDGQTGLTFAPGNADELADAIERLVRNRDEAARLGQNGYDRLVQSFHISRNLESTVQLYDRILG